MLNKKDIVIKHYKTIIERRKFDEYDIRGFLMFIRNYHHNQYNYIDEFSDLVAHNIREKGIIFDSLKNAKTYGYEVNSKGRIKGYKGLKIETFKNQIKKILRELGINYTKETIKELVVCIFSITQDSEYMLTIEDGLTGRQGFLYYGKVKCLIDLYYQKLVLLTEECKNSDKLVVFAEVNINCDSKEENFFIMDQGMETVRIGTDLYINYKNRIICKV